jgi:histone H3/H4
MSKHIFSKRAMRLLVNSGGARITNEALEELLTTIEDATKKLVIDAHNYAKAGNKVTITEENIKAAAPHILRL